MEATRVMNLNGVRVAYNTYYANICSCVKSRQSHFHKTITYAGARD